MFFGAPVWPLKWAFPYDDPIKKIAELGFKGVELIGWNKEAFEEYYNEKTIRELNKLIADLGMVVTNFNYNAVNLASEDPAVRKQDRDIYKRAVETAVSLGSKTLTSVTPYPFSFDSDKIMHIRHLPTVQIWTIYTDLNRDWKSNYETYVEEVRGCCELAAKSGLRVLLEPHPYRMVNSASSMLRLIDKVGMDNLGMNFDPSHLFPSGDMPQCTIYQLGGRIGHTHFSDNDALTNVHWRPGKGKIDWYAVMKALKDVGYNGAINFELEDVPGAKTPNAATGTNKASSMDTELKLSMEFISGICEDLDIDI